MKKKIFTIAETFVGAGGSHLGFKHKGFKSIYINEFDKNCIDTLLYNNPELNKTAIIDHKDICDINFNNLSKKLNKKVDVLFGGVVCKGFSLAGERNPIDERNYLYLKQLDLVKALNPKISIIENVPIFLTSNVIDTERLPEDMKKHIQTTWQELENLKGIKAQKRKTNQSVELEDKKAKQLRLDKKEIMANLKKQHLLVNVFDNIKDKYKELGYTVYCNILNSAWYGSGTARKRAIIVAVRNDIPKQYIFPKITHFEGTREQFLKIPIEITVQPYKTTGQCLAEVPQNSDDIDNRAMAHNKLTKKRFSYIPEGKSIQTVIDTLPEEMKISKFYSRGCTMRLDRNKVSPTLVPGHSNFPVHPIYNRSITVREAATITGFPIDYKFFGSHTSRCEQVGNAVPIKLSEAIAESILKFLK